MRGFVVFALSLWGWAGAAHAQTLSPDELLSSSARHAPAILQALADVRAAEGDALATRGAFDLVFGTSQVSYVNGFYDGQYVDTSVSQNLGPFGARVYGGYRVSRGDFPIYEDFNFTNRGGAARIGVLFSLLKDRAIDDRRFAVRDARLAADIASLEQALTSIGVQRQALGAYWRWVAAGRELSVYEDLLRLAEVRQTNLERQVRAGARAAIFLTENRQNLLRRRALVADARRAFEAAAIELSFYYRDENGLPQMPTRAALPLENGALGLADPISDVSPEGALLQRPELASLRVALDQARNRLALAENELAPKLDLKADLENDFGAIGEGGVSRDATDIKVGVEFSVPLQRRAGRGARARAEAEIDALRARERATRDRIENEIRTILMTLDATREIAGIAGEEVDQADTMARAERRRFESGASDFFLVNLREEAAADSRIRLYQAVLRARLSDADFRAASVDTEALGL
ncbi:MAG: TolC family protein [Pseudomonadota bacterium]